jgi:enoyl-CoA hydratase/carnithine racemase
VVTLNRPIARNSLSAELAPAVRKMIRQWGDDLEISTRLIAEAEDDWQRLEKGSPMATAKACLQSER